MPSKFLPPSSATSHRLLALGECMVRLAPAGHGRIEFARSLEVDVGGGEYNVAHALARIGWRSGFISQLPDNPVARIVLNHAKAAGMDVSAFQIVPFDGVGRAGRVPLNFTEVGIGVRPSVTMYDRGHSALALARPEDFDFPRIFAETGATWLHTGGIMAALSPSCAEITRQAVSAARAAGLVVSYDFNFRSLLATVESAVATLREILPQVDFLVGLGGETRFLRALDLPLPDDAADLNFLPAEIYSGLVAELVRRYPNLLAVATSIREVPSGLINHFGGLLHTGGQLYQARMHRDLEIEDRIGSGDAFAAGLIHGLAHGWEPQRTADFASAYGALLHTTPGDTSQSTLAEVEHIAAGGNARIRR